MKKINHIIKDNIISFDASIRKSYNE